MTPTLPPGASRRELRKAVLRMRLEMHRQELRHEVLKVMQDLAEEGMTMVIVTHEIGFAEKVASRLIFIDKGRIAEDGDPQVLIKNTPSQRLQEFLQHVS